MSEITEKIKQELLVRCGKSKEKDGYDFLNEHIKYKDRYKNIIDVLFVS